MTFTRKHLKPKEILFSSDHFRGVVSDDKISQEATKDAFDVLHYIVAERLAAGLTAIDATNVQDARKPLLEFAKKYYCFAVAIAIETELKQAK